MPAREQESGGQGIVLEPFATELGLGRTAGDIEVASLRQMGLTVDALYDDAVTVNTMSTLSRYRVVYMLTHSGVNQWGEGVVATGQIWNDDPSLQPLVDDGSLLKVGVVGSNQLYYGILSHYLQAHEGQFPADSFVFVNGCMLLRAHLWWDALAQKGVRTLVSWDYDAVPQDNQTTAAAFFNYVLRGLSVGNAIRSVLSEGYGRSTYEGQPAQIGYLGDQDLVLAPLPPTPTATPTATSTLTPTATPSPTPTATSTPRDALHVVLKHAVAPGSLQTIAVHTSLSAAIHVAITYPNGDVVQSRVVSDGTGATTITYRQPGSRIVHGHMSARVVVTARAAGTTLKRTTSYRILFGAVDVSVTPRTQRVGGTVAVWVHAQPRSAVDLFAMRGSFRHHVMTVRTGPRGWAHHSLRVDPPLATRGLVRIQALSHGAEGDHSTSTTLHIQ